jgi:hypothetical protein
MKKIFIVLTLALLTQHGLTQPAKNNLKNLEWILGEWKRTNVKEGKSEVEIWIKKSETEFLGRSIHLKGSDTAFVEKIRLISKDGSFYYVADIPENKEPVFFKIISVGETEFTCENPQHDFPKVIAYKRTGAKLKATISGNGKSIDYLFEKL